jgi:F-type H+-transporting ATPase subunit c
MDVASAKLIGAGLAAMALIGAGVGIGLIFGNYIAGSLRNPGAAQSQYTNLLVGFALCEFTGVLGFVLALIILYGS